MSVTTQNPASSPCGPVHSSVHRQGVLFIISAPSGTGKTTLCKQLVASIPGLWHSISCTTRKPRPGEEHGREYFFMEEATFQQMIDRHEFVEWARVYGHLYGTPRKSVADELDQGIDVLLEIDVQGALQVKKKFDYSVSIFILPPSMAALRTRLQTRASDAPEEIRRRLEKVKEEVRNYREYTYIVRNDDLARSLRELEHIFLAERSRTARMETAWIGQDFLLADEPQSGDRTVHP